MNDWIDIKSDPDHVAREKRKAKELRKTTWWRSRLDAGVCHYCKGRFKPEDITMDHVVPLARGGKSTKGNIVPCCKECNNKKKYMTPVEMLMESLGLDKGDGGS